MVWYSPISQQNTFILPAGDDIFIGRQVMIAADTAGNAVFGGGNGHEAEIYGTLSGRGADTLHFGDSVASSGQNVQVFAGGHIQSFSSTATAVVLYGHSSKLNNAGLIVAKFNEAVAMIGGGVGHESSLSNSGTIKGGASGVHHFGDELFVLTNTTSGLIQGFDAFIGDVASETINNSGRMVGDIRFGDGSNTYNGAAGRHVGLIIGGNGADTFIGGVDGEDFIASGGVDRMTGNGGNDTLSGGDGNDFLTGNAGADFLRGGLNADDFIFLSIADSRTAGGRDTISDFSQPQGDDIWLSAIDANTTRVGNQAFSFIGTKAFSGTPGELRYVKANGNSYIQADVNGDRKIDMEIISDVAVSFVKGDFVL